MELTNTGAHPPARQFQNSSSAGSAPVSVAAAATGFGRSYTGSGSAASAAADFGTADLDDGYPPRAYGNTAGNDDGWCSSNLGACLPRAPKLDMRASRTELPGALTDCCVVDALFPLRPGCADGSLRVCSPPGPNAPRLSPTWSTLRS